MGWPWWSGYIGWSSGAHGAQRVPNQLVHEHSTCSGKRYWPKRAQFILKEYLPDKWRLVSENRAACGSPITPALCIDLFRPKRGRPQLRPGRYSSGMRACTCPLRMRATTLATDRLYSASEAKMACRNGRGGRTGASGRLPARR